MGERIIGDGNDNYLLGGEGDDALDGRGGADTMEGAAGNDLYIVDNAGDTIIEAADQGRDTVKSAIDWTLGANLENLVLTGGAVSGFGNELDNRITGNNAVNYLFGGDGDDTLNGAGNLDTLEGGTGNDVYIVDDWVTIIEGLDGGRDTVRSSLGWALEANIENLVLTGSDTVSGTGNELDNAITGNANTNYLAGGAGDDTLNGGAGADTLEGGEGDDVYVVDEGDTIVESADQGHDTVRSSTDWWLGSDIEDLVLTGSASISGTGNELANKLTGNSGDNNLYAGGGDDSLAGGAGVDYLEGGAGSDTMRGGTGDDTFIVTDAGDKVIEAVVGGTDDIVLAGVDYTLAANVERLYIFDGTHFVGNKGDNTIINGTEHAVSIDGGAGNDVLWSLQAESTLIGGAGDDYYIFSSHDDVVVEAAGGGDDTIEAWHDIDLGGFTNIENLVLGIGGGTTATGNAFDNKITGNAGANVLYGLDGNDTLDGGTNSGGGVSNNDSLYGGNGDDRLEGWVGSDVLEGGDGNDTLVAGFGTDQLTGGAGSDTFAVGTTGGIVGGVDRVIDFQVGAGGDRLDLGDLLTGYDPGTSDANDFVRFIASGGGTMVQVDADGAANGAVFADTVLLEGVALTDVSQAVADGTLILQ
jgi:Ca2+-binding RTX toxin-like protein